MKRLFIVGLVVAMPLFLSCSKDDGNQQFNPEPTNYELMQGTWKESNVTHDSIVSNTQIICNGEHELYTFTNNSFTERYFDDSCNEEFDNGTFSIDQTSFTLTYQDSSVDNYNIVELNETTLKFNFNDGGILVEETYTKIN